MTIEFDPSVDALYVNLSKGRVENTKEVQVGIEVLDVNQRNIYKT